MATYMRGSKLGNIFIHESVIDAAPDIMSSTLNTLMSGSIIGGIPVHTNIIVGDSMPVGLLSGLMQGSILGNIPNHTNIQTSELTDLTVVNSPSKLVYIVGEPLDVSGLVVRALVNGVEIIVPNNVLNFTGFNSDTPAASQTITVSYDGFNANFNISINPNLPTVDLFNIPLALPQTASNKTFTITTSQYTGSINWVPDDGSVFQLGVGYQAATTLTATTGYTFAGLPANSFTVSGATSVTNPAGYDNTMNVLITFPQTLPRTVNIAQISGLTTPVAGAAVDTTITENAQFTGIINYWSPAHTTHQVETAYTCNVTLFAKSGYRFDGVPANFFTCAGASSVTSPAGSGNTITVSIAFPTIAVSIELVSATSREQSGYSFTGDIVAILSNVSWVATSNQPWLHVNAGSTSGPAGFALINCTIDENPILSPRTAILTISHNYYSVDFYVYQDAGFPNVAILPTVVSRSEYAAAGLTATVTSNTSWTATSSQTWLTITNGASGSGNDTITYSITDNNTLNTRSANIMVRNISGSVSSTMTLTQDATTATISISPNNITLSSAAQSSSFNFYSNRPWTIIDPLPSWIINHSATSGNGDILWTFEVTQNTNTTVWARSHYIRFQNSIGWMRSCIIDQTKPGV